MLVVVIVAVGCHGEAEDGRDGGLQVNDPDEGKVSVDARQSAPHLVQQSPFIRLLRCSLLAHQAEAYGELRKLRIVKDRVFVQVLGLHNQRGHHDELAGHPAGLIDLIASIRIHLLHLQFLLLRPLLLCFNLLFLLLQLL